MLIWQVNWYLFVYISNSTLNNTPHYPLLDASSTMLHGGSVLFINTSTPHKYQASEVTFREAWLTPIIAGFLWRCKVAIFKEPLYGSGPNEGCVLRRWVAGVYFSPSAAVLFRTYSLPDGHLLKVVTISIQLDHGPWCHVKLSRVRAHIRFSWLIFSPLRHVLGGNFGLGLGNCEPVNLLGEAVPCVGVIL